MRQRHIQIAVLVVVGERGRERVRCEHRETRRRRHVDERAVAVLHEVVRVALDCADEQIQIAVAVDIGEGGAASLVHKVESDIGRDVDEGAVALVLEQPVGGDVAAGDVDIDVAVRVVVHGRKSARHVFRVACRGVRVSPRPGQSDGGGLFGEAQRGLVRRDGGGRGDRRRRRRTATPAAATAGGHGEKRGQTGRRNKPPAESAKVGRREGTHGVT